LPVITAVEIAPGIAKRRRAYWQAMAETAIIAAIPAINPCGLADGLVKALKIKTAARAEAEPAEVAAPGSARGNPKLVAFRPVEARTQSKLKQS
jgi:hypothetical protein